jgi:hypothetical protein
MSSPLTPIQNQTNEKIILSIACDDFERYLPELIHKKIPFEVFFGDNIPRNKELPQTKQAVEQSNNIESMKFIGTVPPNSRIDL